MHQVQDIRHFALKWATVMLVVGGPFLAMAGDMQTSGMGDVDAIREDVRREATGAKNDASRRSALLRWWRLMWRRGQDMTAFDEVANHLLNTAPASEANWAGIDRGYAVLEEMWANPVLCFVGPM